MFRRRGLCHRLLSHANTAIILGLGLASVGPAAAQGVVLQSTSPAHERGAVVNPGDPIELSAGETVTVLDKSGEVRVFEEPGPYGPGDLAASEGEALTAAEAAIWNGRAANVGGTRSDLNACIEESEENPNLTREECDRQHEEAKTPSRLGISIIGLRRLFAPGAALRIQVVANFDADLSCLIKAEDDGAFVTSVAVGGKNTTTVRLHENDPEILPLPGAAQISAPDMPGDYQMVCTAIDARVGDEFRQLGFESAGNDVRKGFAEIASFRVTTAGRAFRVRD